MKTSHTKKNDPSQDIIIHAAPSLTEKICDFIFLNNIAIHYTIKKTARRNIQLSVNHEGLTVSAPDHVSHHTIREAIQKKADWVLKKIDLYTHRQEKIQEEQRKPQTVLYRGHQHLIWRSDEVSEPIRSNGILLIPAADTSLTTSIQQWLEKEAWLLFADRLQHWAHIMQLTPHSWGLSFSQTSWGSCTNKQRILLNIKLIHLPDKMIEYVIIHELAHLQEKHHKPSFWQLVARYCSYYQAAKSWLSECDISKLSWD